MSIKIQFEIGHTAMLKSKKTIDNFTHDWELYVRGIDKADISAYIDKIVFNLHESFPKPKRTVKEPPYILKESGYAGFIIPIDIYFKNRHMQKFNYDLELQQNGPPVHKSEVKKHIFENPSDDFRQKLIKGGGIYINNDEKNRDSSDEYKQLLNKPKFSSSDSLSSSKKHKIRQDKNKEATFTNIFGTPIQKQPLPSSSMPTTVNNSGIIIGNSGSNSSSNSKVSPDSKSKSSPIVGLVSSAAILTSNKSNNNSSSNSSCKIEKSYNIGQITSATSAQQSSLSSSTSGSSHNINNKDKYEKSDKKDKQNKHSSPHKDKISSSNNNKDGKKDDKHDRRNDRKKDKSHSKERDRSREKNSKQRPPSPQLRQQPLQPQQQKIESPLLPRKFSPLRNSNKEDGHSRKNKSSSSGNSGSAGSGDLDNRKSESKKSKKDKKSHDKDKIRDRRDKERSSSSTNDTQKNKESQHSTTKLTNLSSNNRIDSTSGSNISTPDNNKLDYNKSKDITGSLTKIQSIKKDSKFTAADNYQQTSIINLEKRSSDNMNKEEKRHKHKKKDKTKDKEKSLSRLNKDEITKKTKDIDNFNIASGSSKNQKYSNNMQLQGNDTVTTIANTLNNNNVPLQQPPEPELSESESIINSDVEVPTTTETIKQQKITNHSDSSTNSYKDIVQPSRLKSLQQAQQLSSGITSTTSSTTTLISNTNPNNNVNKKDRKSKENKQIEKEDKKRKRKIREETDSIIAAKKPNSPIATSSNAPSVDQQQTSIPKYLKKTDIKSGSSGGTVTNDSTNIYSSIIQQQDSFRTPSNNISSSHNNSLHSNNNFHNRNNTTGGGGSTIDYMSELRELQKKIMKLQDSTELQQVVELIASTGRYEVTSKTFDFDLCALDRNTVQRLQDFFAATSVS